MSYQPIQHKNKKSNVQDISNIILHNVQITSLISATSPFQNHLSRLFPRSLGSRLNFIKIVGYNQFVTTKMTGIVCIGVSTPLSKRPPSLSCHCPPPSPLNLQIVQTPLFRYCPPLYCSPPLKLGFSVNPRNIKVFHPSPHLIF